MEEVGVGTSPVLLCDHQPNWVLCPLPGDPRDSTGRDFGMSICTHSLDSMGTPTQVSGENKNPFLKLLSANTSSDLRACLPQPPLPVSIKSAGNTPNTTCMLEKGKAAPQKSHGKAAPVRVLGATA